MRMMMKVLMPVDAGNSAVKEGMLQKVVLNFVKEHKPEAAYFLAEDGQRTGLFVFELKDNVAIPSICEPFFMQLKATLTLTPTMNLEEMKQGIDRATKPM
jgi:hypothetical protein